MFLFKWIFFVFEIRELEDSRIEKDVGNYLV